MRNDFAMPKKNNVFADKIESLLDANWWMLKELLFIPEDEDEEIIFTTMENWQIAAAKIGETSNFSKITKQHGVELCHFSQLGIEKKDQLTYLMLFNMLDAQREFLESLLPPQKAKMVVRKRRK